MFSIFKALKQASESSSEPAIKVGTKDAKQISTKKDTQIKHVKKEFQNSNISRDITDRIHSLEKAIIEIKTKLISVQEQNVNFIKEINSLKRQDLKVAPRIDVLSDMVGELQRKSLQISEPAYKTSQENVWGASDHGFRYIVHHLPEDWKSARLESWKFILSHSRDVASACEFGCNIGANLLSIRELNPEAHLAGIEINPHAIPILQARGITKLINGSIVVEQFNEKFDLVFTRGVLIHIPTELLPQVFHNMASHSNKYVLIWENYSDDNYELDFYKPKSKFTIDGQKYQFWDNFSQKFSELYPSWTIVASGIGNVVNKKPNHGDLQWTLFEKS